MALKASRSYKDLSFTFKTNPLRKDLNILKDENAIKRSLLNLFSYRKGEKFFNASFGSGIPDLLFESKIRSPVFQKNWASLIFL